MPQHAPEDHRNGPQPVCPGSCVVYSSAELQGSRLGDPQFAPEGSPPESHIHLARTQTLIRTSTSPLGGLPGQYLASGSASAPAPTQKPALPPLPPPHRTKSRVLQPHDSQAHRHQIQAPQSSKSQGPSAFGPLPQAHSAHAHSSQGPPAQSSFRRASVGYIAQDAGPRDGYKREIGRLKHFPGTDCGTALPRNYDKLARETHHDPIAYEKDYASDSYSSDHRERYDRNPAKERNSFPTFEQGGDFLHSFDKIKKKLRPRDDGGESWSGSPRKAKQGYITGVEQLKNERDYYRAEYEKLKKRAAELDDEIRDLGDALNIEKGNLERARRSADTMQSRMDTRETFLGDQQNDRLLENAFMDLMTDIRSWSGAFSGGSGNKHSLKPERLQDYQKVFPSCAEFGSLENAVAPSRKPRLFVRGWTAYVMCIKLLRSLDLPPVGNSGEDVWIGQNLAQSFHNLENRFWFADRKIVPYKSFNDWRALTAELLDKHAAFPEKEPTDEALLLVKKAVADVMDVAKAWQKNPADQTTIELDLQDIFCRAVQFSRLIRRQRALWSVRFPLGSCGGGPGPLRFDPSFMKNHRVEDDDDDDEGGREPEQRFVEYIITPALFKRGTMDGEKYDSEAAIVVAEVGLA